MLRSAFLDMKKRQCDRPATLATRDCTSSARNASLVRKKQCHPKVNPAARLVQEADRQARRLLGPEVPRWHFHCHVPGPGRCGQRPAGPRYINRTRHTGGAHQCTEVQTLFPAANLRNWDFGTVAALSFRHNLCSLAVRPRGCQRSGIGRQHARLKAERDRSVRASSCLLW
jgi:hypothetical protein